MPNIQWTNRSVKKFANGLDPTDVITKKTRSFILDLIDSGLEGPPFDVFVLAKGLGFSIIPREDVLDARLVPSSGEIVIEYNPNRAPSRIRFSIAHEIAHTFFPDCRESVRNRSITHESLDDWQLELLCNIAAAEILMPIGIDINQGKTEVTIERAKRIKEKYEVSMEAALLRLARLTTEPVTIFAAARESNDRNSFFRIDYIVNSPESTINLEQGTRIRSDSVLSECTAIGYTAFRKEKLSDELPELNIECIGIPPYPGHLYPRILGIITTPKKHASQPPAIRYLVGDATEPRGTGMRIIAHIVSDATRNWGRGFGYAIAKKWPQVNKAYQRWVGEYNDNRVLGNSHFFEVSKEIGVFSMIAQCGWGNSPELRIRYQSLTKCLEALSDLAFTSSATVHMPRIGTGFAGGSWTVISEIINETLIKKGIDVTVYDLPGRGPQKFRSLSEFN